MADSDKLDCTIYVELDLSAEDLATQLASMLGGRTSGPAFGMTISVPSCDIEVRRNSDRDSRKVAESSDEFLFFQYLLEIYPKASQDEMVKTVGTILTWLWSHKWPAVAACDYEDQLPGRGGYYGHLVPGLPVPPDGNGVAKTSGPRSTA